MVELAQLVKMVKQNYLTKSISVSALPNEWIHFYIIWIQSDLHIIIISVKEFLCRNVKISTLYRVGKGDLSCLHYHGIIPCCYQLACKLSITWN